MTVSNNRPDILLNKKQLKLTYLIDVTVPNTYNMDCTISKNKCKGQELSEELMRLEPRERTHCNFSHRGNPQKPP